MALKMVFMKFSNSKKEIISANIIKKSWEMEIKKIQLEILTIKKNIKIRKTSVHGINSWLDRKSKLGAGQW